MGEACDMISDKTSTASIGSATSYMPCTPCQCNVYGKDGSRRPCTPFGNDPVPRLRKLGAKSHRRF